MGRKKRIMPVIFHEKAIKTSARDGVAICKVTPLPMAEWGNINMYNYDKSKSGIDIINDILNSHIEDMNADGYDTLDDYTKGYDSGYKSALEYVLRVLE